MNQEQENMGGPVAVDVAIVGVEFQPGMVGNAAIGEALGYETKCEKRAAWARDGNDWIKLPNYSGSDRAETVELLEDNGVEFCAKEVGNKSWVAICSWRGMAFITQQFERDVHALAAAAHFVLQAKSRVT